MLTAYNWDGQKTDSYTISNAYQSDDAEVRKHCAPRIIGSDGALFWGTAGLYREENGRLVQVTDSPVISVCLLYTSPYGDGKTSQRIVQAIEQYFGLREDGPAPFNP